LEKFVLIIRDYDDYFHSCIHKWFTENNIHEHSFDKHPIIESTCALRYKHSEPKNHIYRRKHRRILVALEGLPDVYHLVNYVLDELSQENNYEIIIRPHPICTMSKLKKHIKINYSKLENVYV